MKSTFLSLWESIQSPAQPGDGNSPLQGSGVESKALHAIRTGNDLRTKKECGNFWDDFLQVLNNREGVAELLEVRPDQLSRWSTRIKEMMDKVNQQDAQNGEKKEMIPTGEAPPPLNGDTRPESIPRPY